MRKEDFWKKIAAMALAFNVTLSFVGCGKSMDPSSSNESGSLCYEGYSLTISQFNEPISLAEPFINSYLEGDAEVYLTFLQPDLMRHDRGLPVTLTYEMLKDGKKVKPFAISEASVTISETENFSQSRIVEFSKDNTSVDVYNLKTGTQYYYKITVVLDDGEILEEDGQFQTMDSVRFMNIPFSTNVRDMGGWKTQDGKKIKQGMLYRGSELDGKKEVSYWISEEGKDFMRNELGIRFDLDLRQVMDEGEYGVLGETVARKYYDFVYYEQAMSTVGAEKLREIFSDLANPDNYPMYIHCTYGCDRTGTLCAILEALLGVSQADIVKDYELSGLVHLHLTRDWGQGDYTFTGLLETMNAGAGNTLQEKVANYLISIGVTQQELDSIKKILLVSM